MLIVFSGYFVDDQLVAGATPTPCLSCIILQHYSFKRQGDSPPDSIHFNKLSQHTSPLTFNTYMEMEDQMESQKRRGMSKEDLICKMNHIFFTVLSSEL